VQALIIDALLEIDAGDAERGQRAAPVVARVDVFGADLADDLVHLGLPRTVCFCGAGASGDRLDRDIIATGCPGNRVGQKLFAVIPGRVLKRVYARLRRAMGANPESIAQLSTGLMVRSAWRMSAVRVSNHEAAPMVRDARLWRAPHHEGGDRAPETRVPQTPFAPAKAGAQTFLTVGSIPYFSVIPGRHGVASPESISPAAAYGFRAHRFVMSRNDGPKIVLDCYSYSRIVYTRPARPGASSRGVYLMEQGAVPAGLRKRTSSARAATGLRPPALRPAARSSLMVRATRSERGGSAARSAARRRNDTAMERRGAQASRVMRCLAPTRCDHSRAPRGAPSLRRFRRKKKEGRPPRAFENRGDETRLSLLRRAFFTLPWRGRVDGVSVARPVGVG